MGGSASTAAKALTVAVNADDAAAIRHAVASPAELNKAIHLASRLGKPAALEELLLKDGININHVAADKMGVPASPILVAIQNRQLKCIVLLLADSRTNLSSTQDKPFRKKGVQEPQFKYDRLKERNEYREGIPLLVQAAKMTSPGSSYHHPDYKEIDPIVLALLLDERRVTVNANISRTRCDTAPITRSALMCSSEILSALTSPNGTSKRQKIMVSGSRARQQPWG